MAIELRVPEVGESIREVQIGKWLKKPGDYVERDEDVVEIETDKASVEIPAPQSGVITEVLKKTGDVVSVGDVVGYMEAKSKKETSQDGGGQGDRDAQAKPSRESAQRETSSSEVGHESAERVKSSDSTRGSSARTDSGGSKTVMPAAKRLLAEHGLDAGQVKATGPGGRLLKEDVQRHVESAASASVPSSNAGNGNRLSAYAGAEHEWEEVVPMSLIRRRIAERLVEAQHQAALLTTFNEIDMSAVMALRRTYQETFSRKHNVKLGFMSFFVKGIIDALQLNPELNAEIRDNNIIYRNYYHIGIAIGGGKGLVVPVLRHAERMSFAEIELAIADFGKRARENRIKPDELMGGTFTISNGGIYGSLLSTPIVNPPQSGVLGMHTIQERPVAHQGQVVIRPMMYVALTYDHRIVDGQGAVSCLKRLKDVLEDPARMLLEA